MKHLLLAALTIVQFMLAGTTSAYSSENNQPVYSKVGLKKVPGLKKYLKSNFEGARLNRETLDIILVDLDQSKDGVDEIIVGVNDFSYSCGSRGCEYHVLRRGNNGRIHLVYAMITSDLVPTFGYSNGMRNLATSTHDDALVLIFDGKTYITANKTVLELRKSEHSKSQQSNSTAVTKPKIASNNQCDLLAASRDDLQATNEPVSFVHLQAHAEKAIEACSSALKQEPENNRFRYQLGRSLLAAGKNTEAAAELKISADAGYLAAMNSYGVLLEYGRGVTKNRDQSLEYITKAAHANHPLSMTNLAVFLAESQSTQDRKNSLEWFTKAATAGEPLAMSRLAWNYGMGDGGAKTNAETALNWVNKALEAGEESAFYIAIEISASGMMNMALANKYQKIAKKHKTKNRLALWSMENWTNSSKLIERFSKLGFRFDRPESEPRYYSQAIFDQDSLLVQYLEAGLHDMDAKTKASAKKFIQSFEAKKATSTISVPVIEIDANSHFIDKNNSSCDLMTSSANDVFSSAEPISFEALKNDAQQAIETCKATPGLASSPRAQYQLGRALIAANRVAEALDFLQKSADAKYPAAMNLLGVLYDHGRGLEIDTTKAFKLFEKAANAGDPVAATNLALYYLYGRGTKSDGKLGTAWLKAAAGKNDAMAIANLGAALIQHHWNLSIDTRRDSDGGTKLLLQAHARGEQEATYQLYTIVAGEIGVLNELSADTKKRLKSKRYYKEILLEKQDKRVIFDDLLKKAKSKNALLGAIEKIQTIEHRIDRSAHEPLYVLDTYLDNDHALAEVFRGPMSGKLQTDADLTKARDNLSYSSRSYNRFDQR